MENNYLSGVSLRFVEDFRLYSEKSFEKAITAVEEVGKYIYDRDKEYTMVIPVDSHGCPICVNVASIGTTISSSFNPREIMRVLALSGACGFIMMHNHPNGTNDTKKALSPSSKDNRVTDRWVKLSNILGITLIDHIIVSRINGAPAYFSYREKKKRKLTSLTKDLKYILDDVKLNKEDFPDVPPVLEGWEKESIFLTAYTEEELKKIMA